MFHLDTTNANSKVDHEKAARRQLWQDLLQERLVFSAGPYAAHVQFSNFCNMSCLMCWDGRNPPPSKASLQLLEKISRELGTHLSVVTPHFGSEPLALGWEETREFVRANNILLDLTTNIQFLDEARFLELVGITETLHLSVDSHIPGIYEIIRPGSNSAKVFANLAILAPLCRKYDLECIVNVVLLTLNAPHLDKTIEWLGGLGYEVVHVFQMVDINGRSKYLDPLANFSKEYVDRVRDECVKAAKIQRMRIDWLVDGCEIFDFRSADHIRPNSRKAWSDRDDFQLQLTFPGFCRSAFNRLRIDDKGDVAPCHFAVQGELSLGNLSFSTFEEIWNGVNAQDLRRGMLTGDLPAQCSVCRGTQIVGPQSYLPFCDVIDQRLANSRQNATSEIKLTLLLEGPTHGSRMESPATFRLKRPRYQIDRVVLGVARGGDEQFVKLINIEFDPVTSDWVEFEIPNVDWADLQSNVGQWWNVWVVPTNPQEQIRRCLQSKCFIRHRAIPRIEGSTIRYANQGFIPICHLGKQGLTPPFQLQQRHTINDPRPANGNSSYAMQLRLPKSTSTEPSPGFRERIWRRFRKKRGLPRVHGFFDSIELCKRGLNLTGWIVVDGEVFDALEFVSSADRRIMADRVVRSDIEAAFPDIESARDSGFQVVLSKDLFEEQSCYSFRMNVQSANRELLQCTAMFPVECVQAIRGAIRICDSG